MNRTRLFTLLPFIILALAIMLTPIPVNAEPQTRHITLTAKQFAYTPPTLRVNRGDRVILTLQSADVVHGFFLDGYGINTRIEPGTPRQIEFIADQTGKFRFRCSVSCGPLHPFMIGELVVGPNLFFARTLGLMAIALAGTLVYLWRFSPTEAYRLS